MGQLSCRVLAAAYSSQSCVLEHSVCGDGGFDENCTLIHGQGGIANR
jgi:hypothetical protein